jgi:hypothetical protein
MRYLFGPEIFWLLLYGIMILPAKLKMTIPKSLDNFLETLWFWMPVCAFFTFALWWVPAVEKNWLFLRVWITCLVGGLYMFEKIMDAYCKTGPGVGTAWMVCAMFLVIALIVGTIVVAIKF